MTTGIVKWFDPKKGYGFVQPEDGSKDVFVHISALERSEIEHLDQNQRVSYELRTEKGRVSAVNIQLLS